MLWTRELLALYRKQANLPELSTNHLDQVLDILNSIHSNFDAEDNLSFIDPTTQLELPDSMREDPSWTRTSRRRRCS